MPQRRLLNETLKLYKKKLLLSNHKANLPIEISTLENIMFKERKSPLVIDYQDA